MLSFIGVALVAQIQIPQPVGYVNDFAEVLPAESERQMLALIDEVRAKSRGEIVVVTLSDLGGRASIDVARDIGRQWQVGAQGGAGDQARNAGVILLLRPGARPGDGQADLAIATGSGAEGFVTDARAGRIRDAIGRTSVERGNYADGMLVGVAMLSQAYAQEFAFELTGEAAAIAVERDGSSSGAVGSLVSLLAFFVMLSIMASILGGRGRGRRRRGSGLEWMLLGMLLGGRRGGGHHGGWGGGGFGGGGFGGFGGGGGFSGGGASGRF